MTPGRTRSLTERLSTDTPQPHPPPHSRPLLTPPNPPPSTPELPHSVRVRVLGHDLYLDPTTARMLKQQAFAWAEKHLSTSGVAHRPPVLSAYVAWRVRREWAAREPPRADSGRSRAKVRYARAVAPWSQSPHRYNGPPGPRPELGLRRSLLTEFPKNGDAEMRRRSLDAASLGVVAAVEDAVVLDPLTLSAADVHKVAWLRPADAERHVARVRGAA